MDRAEQMKKTEAELAELQGVFDLIWKADMRAIEMWQEANPGNDLVWPDGAKLTLWLMGQLDKAEAEVAQLREAQPAPTLAEAAKVLLNCHTVQTMIAAGKRLDLEEVLRSIAEGRE